MNSLVRQICKQSALDLEDKESIWVCRSCLGDYMVKSLVGTLQKERTCAVCNRLTSQATNPGRIARFIKRGLTDHFCVDEGIYPGYEMKLDSVVGLAIGCDSMQVCRAISELLENASADEEDFYWPGQEYVRSPSPFESEDHERWFAVSPWRLIANELVHGQRFFNDRARSFFEQLIGEALEAEDPECPGKPAVVTSLNKGTIFFRSRIANGDQQVRAFIGNPGVELGVAPKERAASNRMSSAGVPLLYLSKELDTCISEVRPSIGDTLVVARFTSTAPLKLFDFTMLSRRLQHAKLSFFDPRYRQRSEHRMLLEYLHEEISRPVRLNDTDYVVTQALADFIRYEKRLAFDGIAFRSVQREGGTNYVLFDSGASAAIIAPDWRPTFHLVTSPADVSTHVIKSVRYVHD